MTDVSPEPGAQTAAPSPDARSHEFTATDDKLWATVAHFGGVIGFPPSLLVFALARSRGSLTRQESKEALNWQITFTIGYLLLMAVSGLVGAVLILASVGDVAAITWALPFALYVVNVVLSITAGIRVNGGASYRYPFSIRLIK
jgi:uncharacterized Tic20 family protein